MPGTFKSLLRRLFLAGIAQVDGAVLVRDALKDVESGMVGLVAVGKAAPAMMSGALSALHGRVEAALLICKRGQPVGEQFEDLPVDIIQAGHPIPDAASLQAGERLRQFPASLSPDTRLVFMISGGASSLAESLPPDLPLADLERLNRFLLSGGLNISQINAVRRSVSKIKGGGLLDCLGGRSADVLLLSDVPDDDPATIGSGPLYPASATLPVGLPDWVVAMTGRWAGQTRSSGSTRPPHRVLGTQDDARAGVAAWARAHGTAIRNHGRELYGDIEAVSARLSAQLEAAARENQRVIHVWSGEPGVLLPPKPGRGGRNQLLALRLARALDGIGGWCLLAAGSDGDDAETGAAGAIADGRLCTSATKAGFDVNTAIAAADSDALLRQCGALLVTGPTATNVSDLVIAISGAAIDLDRLCEPVHTGQMGEESQTSGPQT